MFHVPHETIEMVENWVAREYHRCGHCIQTCRLDSQTIDVLTHKEKREIYCQGGLVPILWRFESAGGAYSSFDKQRDTDGRQELAEKKKIHVSKRLKGPTRFDTSHIINLPPFTFAPGLCLFIAGGRASLFFLFLVVAVIFMGLKKTTRALLFLSFSFLFYRSDLFHLSWVLSP